MALEFKGIWTHEELHEPLGLTGVLCWCKPADGIKGVTWGPEPSGTAGSPTGCVLLGAVCRHLSAVGLTAAMVLGSGEAGQPAGAQGQGMHTQNPQILGALLSWALEAAGQSEGCQEKSFGGRDQCMGGKCKKDVRGLGSYPRRGREKTCLPPVVLETQGLGHLETKNEACGQETLGSSQHCNRWTERSACDSSVRSGAKNRSAHPELVRSNLLLLTGV